MSRRRRGATTAVGLISAAALAVAGCGAPGKGGTKTIKPGDVPDKPKHPVTLNILDIAGNLQLTQGMMNDFVKQHPDIVAKINTSKAPAPQMASKLKAEENSNHVTTSLVLTGTDGLSAGIANNLLTKVLPDYTAKFAGLNGDYQKPAAAMQQLAQGYGVELVYYPSGPLLEYNPAKVTSPPTSPQELLDWAKAHPNKFEYAQPAKTWDYLKQLSGYIKYYPTKTSDTMSDLASGAVDMIASTTGWDINPRVLGTVPNTVKISMMQPMTWVTDAQYAIIPKGVSADVLSADLQLIQFMLQPKEQAQAYDDGYFYPGPAVNGVTIDMAPAKSQDAIKNFGRPEYDEWIPKYPTATSLPAADQVKAFDTWDKTVGNTK